MKSTNEFPAHLFFELLDPSTDIYIYQPEPSPDGYEEETIQSFTWEQLLESSLMTLTAAEKRQAKAKIAESIKIFLEKLEPRILN